VTKGLSAALQCSEGGGESVGLLLMAEWKGGRMVRSVREELGCCCDELCSLAGFC